MFKEKYSWTYGENETQNYYDTYIGKDYLCVLAAKDKPDSWFGFINCSIIYDKTANDKQRKEEGVDEAYPRHRLRSVTVLSSADPEYLMRKVEVCYERGVDEIYS